MRGHVWRAAARACVRVHVRRAAYVRLRSRACGKEKAREEAYVRLRTPLSPACLWGGTAWCELGVARCMDDSL